MPLENKACQTYVQVNGINLSSGGIVTLNDVSLEAREREILVVIGPNGAGKTNILSCMNDFYHPQKGELLFQQRTITHLPPHRIAQLGVSRTFQNIELFGGMSTLDNLMAAQHLHLKHGVIPGGES